MFDNRLVIDSHVHAPHLDSVRPEWLAWANDFSRDHDWLAAYDSLGVPVPAKFDQLLAAQGVDRALLFCEYSPRSTGIQPIEHLLHLVDYNPARFALVANINPHLHFPLVKELDRQLDYGAVALKLHPVHGNFDPGDKDLYPVYAHCAEAGVPVIFHSGISSFPGARTTFGNPELLLDAVDYFTDLQFVFAHGGRGWWYEVAAYMAQHKSNVWLDLAGLPPKKLPEYYQHFDLNRLAKKMIFGTDWPGVPGTAANVSAIAGLGLPAETLDAVLAENALRVFGRLSDVRAER